MPFWMLMQILQSRRYLEEAGSEGTGEGSGQANPETKTEDKRESTMTESEAKLLKEVMQRKQKIKDLETELVSVKSQMARFDGINPDDVKALMKERQEIEQKQMEAKGEWAALKERMAKEHQDEKERILKNLEAKDSLLNHQLAMIEKLTLTHQFDTSNFVRDELVLTSRKAKAIYGVFFDIDENGTVVGYDKPRGEQTRTPLVDAQGNALAFDEAMKRLIDADPDRDELLRSKRRQGAGSSTSAGKPTEPVRNLSSLEKIELGLKTLKK